MEYGYVRVSSRDQNEVRQVEALLSVGVSAGNIFCDKMSGKDFARPMWLDMMGRLSAGDVLYVQSIDRLGRNYDEILEQWRIITKEKGAAIVVLDMPLLDTRQGRDLTGVLIADIVLQLLSYVAETEREFIRKRQKEGISIAKQKGVEFGRPKKERPKNFAKILHSWQNGEISAAEDAKTCGVAYRTFIKWAKSADVTV
ncbi:MAG: recombinase family protein [Bacillota bacterium]